MAGDDPIERLIQQAELIAANALHGATRRQEVADRAEREGSESGRLAALAFVVMYQEQVEGAWRLSDRLKRIRSARQRELRRVSDASRNDPSTASAAATVGNAQQEMS